MNTNSARSTDVTRSRLSNRMHTNDDTSGRYHEQSSHENSSTDDKDDDSNSDGHSTLHFDVFDGLTQNFPLDRDRTLPPGEMSYRKRRLKNNEAARKSREKRRRLDAELRRQLELVIAENRSLRLELKLLRAACGLPATGRSPAPAMDVTSALLRQTTVASLAPLPFESVTSSDVKLEPEESDNCVSTGVRVESATSRKVDRYRVSATGCSSVRHGMTSSDGIGRLLVAASGGYENSGDSRQRSTSSRLGGDVDWKQSTMIGAPGGMISAFHGCSAEPLNLSTAAGVNYESAPMTMLCV